MAENELEQKSSSERQEADSFLIPVPEKNLTCVEYPGKVLNVDRALQTLGGKENISHVSIINLV